MTSNNSQIKIALFDGKSDFSTSCLVYNFNQGRPVRALVDA